VSEGWISLHRRIKYHWLWTEKRQFSKLEAWIDLLLRANHKDTKVLFRNEVVPVERGEFITSERKLAEDWDWSRKKVRRFISVLEAEGMLERKGDHRRTALKIVNYNDYQPKGATKDTTEEPQRIPQKAHRSTQTIMTNNENNENKKNMYTQNANEIFEHWKQRAGHISNSRYTKKLEGKLITKLKKWDKDKIKNAIDNYVEIFNSDFYYSHQFTLFKFIEQGNGAPRFLPGLDEKYDGDIWKDYIRQGKEKQGSMLDEMEEI